LCPPYGEKFDGFTQPPALADAADWLATLPKARAADG